MLARWLVWHECKKLHVHPSFFFFVAMRNNLKQSAIYYWNYFLHDSLQQWSSAIRAQEIPFGLAKVKGNPVITSSLAPATKCLPCLSGFYADLSRSVRFARAAKVTEMSITSLRFVHLCLAFPHIRRVAQKANFKKFATWRLNLVSWGETTFFVLLESLA